MIKTAFLGLGVMGYPMAGHLLTAGYKVTVYNRTTQKAQNWCDHYKGGVSAPTPAQAAEGQDIVFACVGNDDDLRAVTIGENGAFATMKPGSIFVDHTTTSAQVARELAAIAAEKQIAYMDAPVSGGQAGAENGVLTIMCGADKDIFERVAPILKAYAQDARLIGPVGNGQLAKMVNQICIAGVVQGLSEAIAFGQKSGLDMEAVLETISKGAAGSWQMVNRGKTMIADQFDFGFAIDWMRKDLGICLDEARRNGATLPLTALVDQFYADVQRMGGNRLDTSSLIKRLR